MVRIRDVTNRDVGQGCTPMGSVGLSMLSICKRLQIVVLAALMTASAAQIAGSAHARGAATSTPQMKAEPPDEAIETWRDAIAQKPVVKEGCFTAAYPDTTWREVACATASNRSLPTAPVHRGLATGAGGSAVAGNGNDWVAQVNSGVIVSATGSFDTVNGVLNEQDGGVVNSFSLQLNTNNLDFTPACARAPNPACQGWEQFLLQNSSADSSNLVYIQYWLLNYNTDNKTCPSGFGAVTPNDCLQYSPNSASVPTQPITDLAKLKLTGKVNANGTDTVILTTRGGAATAVNQDSVLGLGAPKNWKQTEFNVFGWCCAQQANFNSGVTLVARTQVSNNTKNPPSCVNNGTTGEQIDLNLGSCKSVGGSAPAITFTESNPPGSIWHYTGSPCKSGKCAGWKEFDDNNDGVRIASTGGNVYQLHNSGSIWSSTNVACTRGSCPGWTMVDDNSATSEIVAGGAKLYQLHYTGEIYVYAGGPCCAGWQKLDDNKSTAVTIAAASGGLYAIHNTGNIWKYTGTPCNGSVCSGWGQLDSNKETVAIVTEGSNLYQLHSTGSVWKYTGTPCSNGKCPGWQLLNNNSKALQIAASGGNLYELDTNGAIWKYTGTPCNGDTCKGWQMLDNNPAAIDIAADGSSLYELHNTGNLFSYTGTPCRGASCSGWQQIDNDAWTGRIAASNGQLYQLHVIQTPRNRSLECYECR